MRILFTVILFTIIGPGCSGTINTQKELLEWINDDSHGLKKTKTINGFEFTAKYLPPQYLVLKEAEDPGDYDSLLSHYATFRTFLLTIGPDPAMKDNDIMFHQVTTSADYRQRAYDLNFTIRNLITLSTPSHKLRPVLHTFENTYELARHKSIYLVFADHGDNDNTGLLTAEKLTLKYTDDLFGTGISHFVFDKNDLDDIPFARPLF